MGATMPKELQPVPPWVQIFAALNPDGVEIIEMTDPIVTGMASVDQPIQERFHESVYLLRNGLTPDMVKYLEGIVGETFPAIAATSFNTTKATRVGKGGYHSWQAVRHQNCTCMYKYAGTRAHKLYQYEPMDAPMDQYVVNKHMQPKVVSQLLEALWSKKKGILATQEEKFQHASSLCPMNALIVNKYADGSTIDAHTDNVQLSSKGQTDDLHSGTVVTITLHATGVFFIEPNRHAIHQLGYKKSDSLRVPGRVAVMTHPGDLVVMAGGSMRSQNHGTKPVSEWPRLHEEGYRCIDFNNDEHRRVDPLTYVRYSLALRCNRYHSTWCPRQSYPVTPYGDVQYHKMEVWQPNG